MNVVVDTDGNVSQVDLKKDDLKTLQKLVGGHIERLPDDYSRDPEMNVWINEEGRIDQSQINDIATKICVSEDFDGFHIYGDVVIENINYDLLKKYAVKIELLGETNKQ